MPTQEDRLTALEQNIARSIDDINHNCTMLLGTAVSQGERIHEMNQRLGAVETRLVAIETHLDSIEATQKEHTVLLSQILERLPKA